MHQEIKEKLYEKCLVIVKEQISNAESVMRSAHESMMGETKSSAGDKFETSRAMLQGEQDRMKSVIIKNKALEYTLSQISLQPTAIVQTGALVQTSNSNYYIAVGLGKIVLDKKTYFAISTASPIGQLMQGLKAKDSFSFRNKLVTILDVC